jgi:hypothetical protein
MNIIIWIAKRNKNNNNNNNNRKQLINNELLINLVYAVSNFIFINVK